MYLPISHSVVGILLLPLCGFFTLFLLGRMKAMQRIGDRIATLIMLVVWMLALNVFGASLSEPDPLWMPLSPDQWVYKGLGASLATSVGALSPEATREIIASPERFFVAVGLMVDHLTAAMLLVVASVSFFVHLFSIGYMHGDRKYLRFFAVLQIFTFAMLGLVLSDNLLTLYVCWEIMGFSSYALIGHFWEERSAQLASIKAFMTTRVGDVLMFVGIMIIWSQVGSLRFQDINAAIAIDQFTQDWRFWAGVLLFAGAVGKSAQFPLHVWLPDAMEGPTPVSALIHAATMVAAGVYLVARSILIMTPEALMLIAYVGGFTALFAATIAVVQDDIKKVLAYSTISQLGYMMLGLGLASITVYGYSYGMYHLTTHAFFKACLFLGSGSIIHAMHHEQRMSKYGGLWKKMPITWLTFLYATLCLCGVPWITSGFFSKDGIITSSLEFGAFQNTSHILLPFFAISAAAFTTFYMFRAIFLTFTGKPRDEHAYEHAHESSWVMTVPLIVLAAVAGLLIGDPSDGGAWFKQRVAMPKLENYHYVTDTMRVDKVPPRELERLERWDMEKLHFEGSRTEHARVVSPYSGKAGQIVSIALGASPVTQGHGAEASNAAGHDTHDDAYHRYHTAHNLATMISGGIVLGFFILAALFYWGKLAIFSPAKWKARMSSVHAMLWNKYYVDEFYQAVFVAPTIRLCNRIWQFDDKVIDGVVNGTGRAGVLISNGVGFFDNRVVDGAVNSVSDSVRGWGGLLSRLQSGNIRHYLMGIVAGVTLLVICFLLFPTEIAYVAGRIGDLFLWIGDFVWSGIVMFFRDVFLAIGELFMTFVGWIWNFCLWVADLAVAVLSALGQAANWLANQF